MTVKQLKELLSVMPDDANVIWSDDFYSDVEYVRLDNDGDVVLSS